jgi:hypothetical protein
MENIRFQWYTTSYEDIDNYFQYKKNPTIGKRVSFEKHMVKAYKEMNTLSVILITTE